ncbi:hypothetical protein CVT24_010623 [Panaeolus cyanescens]|uniref:Uncharacterized protein n=1 Tax=Panaeolus cyanescens TaxID=181874 RepID=A0A409YLZ1_9AGAR|nr:hypothetical protein CVT24_010623 [Panaeolus cyanescens]
MFKRKREDSDDEEEASYGRQILPVANLPDDFDQEPMDGMQYLFTVRRAARQLPDIVRVPNPFEKPEPTNLPESIVQPSSDSTILPSEEWRQQFEMRFHNFRKNFDQPTLRIGPAVELSQRLMPAKKERDLWWAFICGQPESHWNPSRNKKSKKQKAHPVNTQKLRAWADEPSEPPTDLPTYGPVDEDSHDATENPTGSLPSPVTTPLPLDLLEELSQPVTTSVATTPGNAPMPTYREPNTTLLKRIDHPTAIHLLMYFTHWLNLYLHPPFDKAFLPTQTHARWILCLLSRVDDVVCADDMNLLRNLARAILAFLKATRTNPEPSQNLSGAMTESWCWIIITVVADVWKQRDLWMDAEQELCRT